MTPAQIARDALVRIASLPMESPCALPAITDEVVKRCAKIHRNTAVKAFDGRKLKWDELSNDRREATLVGIRAALEEFVRQTRPENIRSLTEQEARAAAMAAVRPMYTSGIDHGAPTNLNERWDGSSRQARQLTHPEEIRRATEQAARAAAMAAVIPSERWKTGDRIVMPDGQEAVVTVFDDDTRAAVYTHVADDEAGRVAWGNGEPFDPWKSEAWQAGWRNGQERWG